MASNHGADRLVGFHGVPHVSGKKLPKPDKVLYIKGFVQSHGRLLGSNGFLGNTGSLKHFQGTARKTHDGIVNNGNAKQGGNSNQNTLQYIFCHTFPSSFSNSLNRIQAVRWLLPGTAGLSSISPLMHSPLTVRASGVEGTS